MKVIPEGYTRKIAQAARIRKFLDTEKVRAELFLQEDVRHLWLKSRAGVRHLSQTMRTILGVRVS
jgi:hypothetical protein